MRAGLRRPPSRSTQIESGDGEGEQLLPVANTSSPVDLDLLNDILRLPYRERFAILLSEFGTGLAGRGEELNEVIHRANPALRETDKLLAVLAQARTACWPASRATPTRRSARSRASASSVVRLDRPGQRAPARPRPSGATTSAAASTACPGSCASCGR